MDISIAAEAIASKAEEVLANLDVVVGQVQGIKAAATAAVQGAGGTENAFLMSLTVFVLACVIGYYVIWSVTPALHSPLMAMTNAISSVVVVGAILVLGSSASNLMADVLAFIAIVLASVNIFGGLSMTQRMIQMFKKKAQP